MPFVEFSQKGARARFGFPTVTLLRSGGLSLNAAAYAALHEPSHVVMAFDSDEKRIGIRAAVVSEGNAYPVKGISDDSFWVAAQGFIKYYALAERDTVRYRAQFEEPFLAIDLRAEPVQRERRKVSATDPEKSEVAG